MNAASPKPKSKLPEPSYRTAVPLHPSERSERVLTIGEAAARLGISGSEMEAMVKLGTVKSLMAGWTVVVPTSEVERLRSGP
jgi:excisionase family DNA binding protein